MLGASESSVWHVARVMACLVSIWIVSACAWIQPVSSRPDSTSLPSVTQGKIAKAARATMLDAKSSGFRLLPSGAHALAIRLELIRSAERSVDLQYFIVQPDATGKEVLRELRDAASRNVRVRLLIDDLYTQGGDELLRAFAAHANVEVRVFNPFLLRRGNVVAKFAAQPFSFERLNHRMHNKLFVADGVAAITGGRNIGDEYFSRRDAGNFIDLDVLAVGQIAVDASAQFDQYWNSSLAVSITAIRHEWLDTQQLQSRFDSATRAARAPTTQYDDEPDVLGQTSPSAELRQGRLELTWGVGQSFADPPEKGVASSSSDSDYGANPARMNAIERIRGADEEVLLTSPYFIPGRAGLDLFRKVVEKGTVVDVLTNSLASTDQPLVHGAYRSYRVDLLKAGVQLHELSASQAGRDDRKKFFGLAAAGLHTKCLVIDRQELVIGSMNFDPRSDHYNTENGIAIYVPSVARDAVLLHNLAKRHAANRLEIGSDGHLEWWSPDGARQYAHDQEPDVNVLLRLWLRIVSPLAPESLL